MTLALAPHPPSLSQVSDPHFHHHHHHHHHHHCTDGATAMPTTAAGDAWDRLDSCRLSTRQRTHVADHFWQICVAFSTVSDVDTPPYYTVFHSSAVPGVTLLEYYESITTRLPLGRPCFSIAFVLVRRYWDAARPSHLAMHRLFAAALLLAMKVFHDRVWSNAVFANACGLSLNELNGLEIALLKGLLWDTFVTSEDVDRIVGGILRVEAREAAYRVLHLRGPRRACTLPQLTVSTPSPSVASTTLAMDSSAATDATPLGNTSAVSSSLDPHNSSSDTITFASLGDRRVSARHFVRHNLGDSAVSSMTSEIAPSPTCGGRQTPLSRRTSSLRRSSSVAGSGSRVARAARVVKSVF